MDVTREAAPEIDRLVLSVNGRMSRLHDDRLSGLASERGLDSLELLPHFADFLLAGRLTADLATLRMRYWPPERVLGRLEEWERRGLIEDGSRGLQATREMETVLEALQSARADTAADMWSAHGDEVATATHHARQVSASASSEHDVAVAHRELPEPADPYLRLHQYLTNLRYIRQHDHAQAWVSRGLTAPAMVVMTSLWHGDPVDPGADGLDELQASGLAAGPAALTDAGRELREAIEEDTNRRAQASFRVLDAAAGAEFLTVLRKLPGRLD